MSKSYSGRFLYVGKVLPHEAPWKGFRPLCCSPPLAASVGSAAGSLCSSCTLVGVMCISRPILCIGLSYGAGTWPQRLRTFARRFPRGSIFGAPPPNIIVPCSMTGGPAAPTVDWSCRICPWGYLTLVPPQDIFTIPPLHIGEVYTKVYDEDWVHTVWVADEWHRDVIGLIWSARRDVEPNAEQLILPCCHMESEGVGD